jgi:para-nitrobenzyl esterase
MRLLISGLVSVAAFAGAAVAQTPPPAAGAAQAPAAAPARARPELVKATIDSGVIVGESKDGVNVFKGVPFAKPPIGELRWRAPQKPDKWAGERYATAYESPCPQPTNADGKSANGGGVWGTTNEDCLYLNVYAPKDAKNAPIVVWLYGGASYLGAGHLGGYNGTANAKQGVITIPINYRLGSLGNFSHPALSKEAKAKGEGTGSYALMDAVAALEWAKRNAAAFGGDPNNITIAGQSAGGGMVVSLLSIPSAKGLYQKAIIESGAGLRPGTPLAEAEKSGSEAATKLGLAGDKATAAQLRAISSGTLVGNPATQRGFGSPLDGKFKTAATVDALNAGNEIDVPVMVGSNNGEGGFDGARTVAKLTGDSGAGAWLYQFAYVPEWRKAAQPQGAPHSAEIVYAFDSWDFSSSGDPKVNATDRAVSKRVNSCWVAFFKMDPKAKSLTCADGFNWPAYTDAGDDAARFEETPKLVKSKSLPSGPPPGAPRGSMAPN